MFHRNIFLLLIVSSLSCNFNRLSLPFVFIVHEHRRLQKCSKMSRISNALFCVIIVTPSKIKMQTSQYRKSRIWEMKEDKYTKSLAKNQVSAIIDMQDIRKNVLPKFIRLCMKTPSWCPFKCHKFGRQKQTETSVMEFCYLCVNSSLEELIRIKVVFILRQGMFRQKNLKKTVTFL